MAKRKLFGNHIDPSCETCAHGMVSSDGETVLCRYAGAPSRHHHCKRFRYDPLKRTPHRQPRPAAFTAADFALDDPTADLMAPPAPTPEADPARDAMLTTLRDYLDGTDAPSADDILELLSVSMPQEEPDADSDSEPETEPAPVDTPVSDGEEMTDIPADREDESPASADAVPQAEESDESPADGADAVSAVHSPSLASEDDIRRDMELLSVERNEGASTRAALGGFEVHLSSDEEDFDSEEDDLLTVDRGEAAPALLLPSFDDDEEDDSVLSDDLLFVNLDDLSGGTIESLSLNPDGTLSTTTEDL